MNATTRPAVRARSTAVSSTAPAGAASTTGSAPRVTGSPSCRTRPCRSRATWPPPSRSSTTIDGPAVLVGHSYGGVVVTETGSDPRVAGLVYIAAFAPDKGESVNTLIADPPPGAPVPPILPPRDGYLFLDRDKFHDSFAGDLPADEAAFMADSQVPWGVGALGGTVTEPGWRTKPSWYLVAADDRMIPPPAQRAMAERAGASVREVPGSHSVYVSQPQAVADLIHTAVESLA